MTQRHPKGTPGYRGRYGPKPATKEDRARCLQPGDPMPGPPSALEWLTTESIGVSKTTPAERERNQCGITMGQGALSTHTARLVANHER